MGLTSWLEWCRLFKANLSQGGAMKKIIVLLSIVVAISAVALLPRKVLAQTGYLAAQILIPAANVVPGSFPSGNYIVTGTVALTAAIFTPTTPADSAACTVGTIWSDATYLYRCVSSGTVYRSQMSWTNY